MKSTKKMAVLSFPLQELTSTGHTIDCTNLLGNEKSTDGETGLTAAPGLVPAIGEPLHPLASLCMPDGTEALLLRSDNVTGVSDGNRLFVFADGTLHSLRSPDAEIYCAAPQHDGWLVMTSAGQLTVKSDSNGRWTTTLPGMEPPDISLTTIRSGSISATTAPLSITDVDFDRAHPMIGGNGTSAITSALLEAYSDLCARAADSGAWMQPMLARCHLIDSQGRRLYSTEPQLIGNGWQCCGPMTVECSKSGTTLNVPQQQLSTDIHSLQISITNLGAYASLTDSVEVNVVPQLHPVDFSGQADIRLVRASAPSPALTVALPGTTASMADNTQAHNNRIAGALARIGTMERKITVLPPDTLSPVAITNRYADSAKNERALTDRALTRAAVTASAAPEQLLSRISPPHSFIARCAAINGDTVAWADITPLTAPPARPLAFTPGTDEETDWTGTVRVTMAGGLTADTLIGHPMTMPEALPALVSYPDPKAVKLEIWVQNNDTDTIRHVATDLKPAEDNTRAFHLESTLTAIPLEPWDGTDFPRAGSDTIQKGRRQAGAVIKASAESPGTATGAVTVTASPVVAIHPAVKTQSSWDFTRCRLHAFSPAGIFTVAFSRGNSPASTLIAPHHIMSANHLTLTSSGVAALASNGMLLMVAATRCTTLMTGLRASHIAWHAVSDRIWALRDDGTVTICHPATGRHATLAPPHSITALHTIDDRMLVCTPHLTGTPASTPDTDTCVSWSARMQSPPLASPQWLRVDMTASRFRGSIELRTDGGAGSEHSLPLVELHIDGAVNAPVTVPLTGRLRNHITLSIKGDTSPDFTMTKAGIYLK